MAEDSQANIRINVDTAAAMASIKNLQREISLFQTQLSKGSASQQAKASQFRQNLVNDINATGKFSAQVKTIKTTTESFTSSLEKNKLSMGEYFRYSGASTKSFGKLFKSEFETINKVARERVKDLQTQYIKLGRDANGAMKAISIRPLSLDMESLATKTQIAAQKQALLNQMLKQGSTNLLNFGKNTQWAGRQLMVGFTIPLTMFAATAAKAFMDLEKQAIRFKRVYGEMFTTTEETNKALEDVKKLAGEFTKYGISVAKTMELAADAAAMGKMGADLTAQVAEASRLAVLGGVEQAEALKTTISLTDAFSVSAENLAKKTDFLNAVENQTVTSIEDLTIAIPKAGPVIQQLGGDVEDLAFFLTAMKEGGINASEGANALKSGLASLINPAGKASEMLNNLGINISGIVEANKGDVKGLVIDFAKALDTLDPLSRARAIEQLFGKFQFARVSTLFQNVIKEGSQANRVLKLTQASSAELAVLSERELKKVEDSPMFKFQKAVEDLKVTLVPLGEAFLKAVTPILQFGTDLLNKFNELGAGAKSFVVNVSGILGVIGPVFLMGFGLIANGVANVIKLFVSMKSVFNKTGVAGTALGGQIDYMTSQQLEAAAVAASLDQSHAKLIQTFSSETGAVNLLSAAYTRATAAQTGFIGTPGAMRGGKGKSPKKLASGIVSVPGPKGAGDIVPAMLSPGEAVIPAKQAKKYAGFIRSMIAGKIPGFAVGAEDVSKPQTFAEKRRTPTTFSVSGGYFQQKDYSRSALMGPGNTPGGFGIDKEWLRSSKDAQVSWMAAVKAGAQDTMNVSQGFKGFSKGFDSTTTELLKTYRGQIDSVSNIEELGKKTYPAMKKQLSEAVKTGKITLREAAQINIGTKALVNPTPADYTQTIGGSRYEGGVDKEGNLFVKRAKASERKGKSLKNRIATLTAKGRESAGLGAIPKDYSFAHMSKSRDVGQSYLEPQIRTAESASDKKAAQAIAKELKRGGKVRQGQVIVDSKGKVVLSPTAEKDLQKSITQQAQNAKKDADVIKTKAKTSTKEAKIVKAQETVVKTQTTNAKSESAIKGWETRRARAEANIKPSVMKSKAKPIRASRASGIAGAIGGAAIGAGSVAAGLDPFMGLIMGQMAYGPIKALFVKLGANALRILGPIGLVAGALAGVGIAFYNTKKQMDAAAKSSREMNQTLGASSSSLQAIAEFSGAATPGEIMAKISAGSEGRVAADKTGFGAAYISTEAGQKLVEEAKKAIAAGGVDEAVRLITAQLGTAVAAGLITPEQAKAISLGLGAELKDYGVALSINVQLNEILGPNGENLLDGGSIDVLVNLIGTASVGAGGAQASVQNLIDTSGEFIGIFDGGAQADLAAREAKAASEVDKLLDMKQLVVDAYDAENLTLIENLELQGKYEEAAAAQVKYEQGRAALISKTNTALEPTLKSLRELEGFQGVTVSRGKTFVERTGKDTARAAGIVNQTEEIVKAKFENPATKKIIENIANANVLSGEVKVNILTGFGDGISEDTWTQFSSYFDPKEDFAQYNIISNISSKLDPRSAGTAMNILKNFTTKEGKVQFLADISISANKDPKGAKKTLALIDEVILYGQAGIPGFDAEIRIKAIMDPANQQAYDKAIKKFKKLQKDDEDGKLTVTQVIESKIIADPEAAGALRAQQEYFEGLPSKQQIEWLEIFTRQYNVVAADEIAAWRATNPEIGNRMTREQIAAHIAGESATSLVTAGTDIEGVIPPVEPIVPNGAGAGAKPEDPFAEILKSLKRVAKASIDASGGLKELYKQFKAGKGIKITDGIDERILNLASNKKMDSSFSQFLMNASKKTRNLLTDFKKGELVLNKFGKAARLAFATDSIAKMRIALKTTSIGIRNQVSAVKALTAGGLSLADALNIASDAEYANAIASAVNLGQKKKLKKIIAEINQLLALQAQADAQQASADKISEQQDFIEGIRDTANEYNNLAVATKKLGTSKYSFAEQMAILSDPQLVQLYLDGGNLELLKARITQTLSPEFIQSLFEQGFSNAMDTFSAQETKIQIKFQVDTAGDESILLAAQKQIAGINYAIDDLDAELKRIQDKEEVINKEYDDRIKALDEIQNINEQINRDQSAQLNIAAALSSGDIAAAAAAARELQKQRQAAAVEKQKKNLELSREKALSAVVGNNGKTRIQIAEEIKTLQDQIFNIEEKTLEPTQRKLELLTDIKDAQILALEVAENTRLEWEAIQNGIDLARTSSVYYKNSIQDSLDLVKELQTAWTNFTGPSTVNVPGAPATGGGAGTTPVVPPTTDGPDRYISGDVLYNKMVDLFTDLGPNNREDFMIAANLNTGGKGYPDWKKARKAGTISNSNLNKAITMMSDGNVTKAEINAANTTGGFNFSKNLGGKIGNYSLGNIVPGRGMTDKVPGLLTPGEFVVRKSAAKAYMPQLQAINSGLFPNLNAPSYGMGNSNTAITKNNANNSSGVMYNSYSVNVNVKSDSNPDQIAKAVMTQIKQIDSQRIRSNRF